MKQDIVFNEKKHVWNGAVSCIMAGLESILFLVLVLASCMEKGNAGSWVGTVCVGIFLMAIWGIYIGCCGVQKKKLVYKGGSWAGIFLNFAVIAGLFVLFFSGL